MTAPTIFRQAPSTIFNQTANISDLSRRQSEIVGDYTCRLHLALNHTQSLNNQQLHNAGTQLKFSNLSSHLKTPLYQEIVKKVDEGDMSERRKIRKKSHFMNEITFQYLMQNKKRGGLNESTIESEGSINNSSRKKSLPK